MRKRRRYAFFTEPFCLRLAPDTAEWLKEKAYHDRMSPSTLVRKLLETEARRDLQPREPLETREAAS